MSDTGRSEGRDFSLINLDDQTPIQQLRSILRAVANGIATTNRNLEQVAEVVRSTPQHTDRAAELLRGVEHTVELMAGLMQIVNDVCNLLESNGALATDNHALEFRVEEEEQ
ncbi:hypothetical protein PT974_08245 [Cladobotryum mycophilum]|uniref:Uncharacterized protein n=1 Tax=Cladobotryum mycophilum TaxID=491253 RepID=A0ABR0SCT5_9HYPO